MTLRDVITQADDRILIVPSFQRGFKWKPENIRKLLESLILNYPIGAVLIWQTPKQTFDWRTLESVQMEDVASDEVEDISNLGASEFRTEPFKYILDGQQRLTSIYKIFPNSINKTTYEQTSNRRNREIYRFFIDLEKLNFPELDKDNYLTYQVDFTTDVDRKADSCVYKNFDTIRKEYRNRYGNLPDRLEDDRLEALFKEKKLLPLTTGFLEGNNYLNTWIQEKVFNLINRIGGGEEAHRRVSSIYNNWLISFNREIQTVLVQKTIPVIQVPERTDSEGLSRIFETVNSTGLSLTTFDLLVAKMSIWKNPEENNLRNLIKSSFENNSDLLNLFDDEINLGGVACQQLPRIFALNVAKAKNSTPSLKKSEILDIDRNDLIKASVESCHNLKFSLVNLRDNLGVKDKTYLPFKDAITLSAMVSENEIKRFQAYYWFVLFTEKDLDKDSNSVTKKLYTDWLRFRQEDASNLSVDLNDILEEKFPSFNEVLGMSNSSALLYKAFLTFVFSHSTRDWRDNDVRKTREVEDHHIYPKEWLSTTINEIGRDLKENILNRVLISKAANGPNGAGNFAPYVYLRGFKNMHEFQLPESFLTEQPYNKETLLNQYEARYKLLKTTIFKKINSLLLETQ